MNGFFSFLISTLLVATLNICYCEGFSFEWKHSFLNNNSTTYLLKHNIYLSLGFFLLRLQTNISLVASVIHKFSRCSAQFSSWMSRPQQQRIQQFIYLSIFTWKIHCIHNSTCTTCTTCTMAVLVMMFRYSLTMFRYSRISFHLYRKYINSFLILSLIGKWFQITSFRHLSCNLFIATLVLMN